MTIKKLAGSLVVASLLGTMTMSAFSDGAGARWGGSPVKRFFSPLNQSIKQHRAQEKPISKPTKFQNQLLIK